MTLARLSAGVKASLCLTALTLPGYRGLGADERRARRSRSAARGAHRRLRRQRPVRRRRHSGRQHADLRRAERRRSGRRRAAAARHLHDDGLLQGSRPLVRSALLPLQLVRRPRADLGRVRGAADRRRSAALGRLGILRPRLPARGDREPVRLRDGEGALRRAARGDARQGRADRLHASDAARLERPVPAPTREDVDVVQRRRPADPDLSLAADAGVSEALRAADVSLLRQQRGAVAGLVLLARRVHAALRAVRRRRREPRHDAGSRSSTCATPRRR